MTEQNEPMTDLVKRREKVLALIAALQDELAFIDSHLDIAA